MITQGVPGSEIVVANTLAKFKKKLEPYEINFSHSFSQKYKQVVVIPTFSLEKRVY